MNTKLAIAVAGAVLLVLVLVTVHRSHHTEIARPRSPADQHFPPGHEPGLGQR